LAGLCDVGNYVPEDELRLDGYRGKMTGK